MKNKDLTGRQFGKLTVLRADGARARRDYREVLWLCRCDCGVEKTIGSRALLHKVHGSKSCGCVRSQKLVAAAYSTKHGLKQHRLYPIWKTMRMRCNNPNNHKYANYGGRGIRVCERWSDFKTFLDDMGPSFTEGLSLDRIDVNGHYEPGNCRWATYKVQANNRERSGRLQVVVKVPDTLDDSDLSNWMDVAEVVKVLQPIQKQHDSPFKFYRRITSTDVIYSLEL